VRAAAACGLCVGGVGSRSKENGMVVTGKLGWAVSELGRDVSIREFPAQISRDTRTRRGYVSLPYPGRIRIGYVSDTGYARNLPCPCF